MSLARGRAALLRSASMKRGVGDPVHSLLLLQSSAYTSGHYTCHVCWEKGSGPVYHCPDCQFDVHVACAGTGVGGGNGIHAARATTHFSHFEHPLLPKSSFGSNDEVVCNCCGDIQHGSSAVAYRCNQCDFDLCALCIRAPRYLLHVSHPHILMLLSPGDEDMGRASQCDGCGEVGRGMVYRCVVCNFDLHASCARLPLCPSHALHRDHPLTLTLGAENGDLISSSYTCDACGHHGRGWAYECSLCSFHLHPHCGVPTHELPRSSSSLNARLHSAVPQRASSRHIHPHLARHSSQSLHGPLNRSYSSSQARRLHHPLSHHTYSSLDSPYSSYSSFGPPGGGELWNDHHMSSTNLADALSQRLRPSSSHDADALDRVTDMLRTGAYSPSFR